MTTAKRFLSRTDYFKEVARNRWIFSVPTRKDKHPSGSARYDEQHGKLLLHDFGGSTAEEMVKAVGLTLSDLFDSPKVAKKPDPATERRQRALIGLERWRQRTLTQVCLTMRRTDSLVADAGILLAIDPDSETAWTALATAYHTTTALKYDFDRLSLKDAGQHLDVWREHKEVAHAAA